MFHSHSRSHFPMEYCRIVRRNFVFSCFQQSWCSFYVFRNGNSWVIKLSWLITHSWFIPCGRKRDRQRPLKDHITSTMINIDQLLIAFRLFEQTMIDVDQKSSARALWNDIAKVTYHRTATTTNFAPPKNNITVWNRHNVMKGANYMHQ